MVVFQRVVYLGEMWSSLSESDQFEAFNQLQMEEKRLRKDGILNNNVHQLLGYKVGVCTLCTFLRELNKFTAHIVASSMQHHQRTAFCISDKSRHQSAGTYGTSWRGS